MSVDFNIKIGGEAGQGLQTIGQILSKIFLKGGFYVFGTQFYLSRIRGGHNYYQARVSDNPVKAITEDVNMLVALDKASIDQHFDELSGGVILVDKNEVKIDNNDESIFHVPFTKLAEDVGGKIYSNTVAVGAALGLLCYDFDRLKQVLNDTFSKKGEEIVNKNIEAASSGYNYAQENYEGKCHYELKAPGLSQKRMLITGNEAVGLGALASGIKFISAYPMTPSTGVLNYISSNSDKFGVAVEQAEDEISALNMSLGASFAGARSMVTTSGGGFSLMAEAVGLSGETETPVVIFLGQRPGPSTGLPTMTEQGDLEFALHASQGEFPRCIFAPKTPDDAFYLTSKAFNMADNYQIPAIIMSDQYLADSEFTCDKFDTSKIRINKHLLTENSKAEQDKEYKRYEFTTSGISPRALPGKFGSLVVADSDEHDEYGHIDQTIDNRIKMNKKRLNKLDEIKEDISEPEIYGSESAKTTLVGWGSTYGPLTETVDILRSRGVDINLVHFNEVYPLPTSIESILENATTSNLICVENNATGQFSNILKVEAGVSMTDNVLKYDGKPFTPAYLVNELDNRGVL
ncbi:pyruvate flavodoxin/ferredoxin oxidoreductase domain protein [Methanohalobium evestigatum Z-7303]|uniref:2-oxoglutarate synthase subunit KorA n=1 Tax=Methanohalobium evestigatum (strain ATCC BAA-1072 / DSM 3721 / NBRC 107634 / OCM 161 / Z-7303) TaxID=644295 RepID=D7EAW4_METEZ|nr:2-oxoacid:acceptor oxidoreductase subunit alpha [Methanohalobium evestigatum]ADI74481.1 pyruvate flavodoxin/ferredoxin oxidoreductase domain protein [Methanohalobium evestigatum Z-7303]